MQMSKKHPFFIKKTRFNLTFAPKCGQKYRLSASDPERDKGSDKDKERGVERENVFCLLHEHARWRRRVWTNETKTLATGDGMCFPIAVVLARGWLTFCSLADCLSAVDEPV